MFMIDILISVFLVASVLFLIYELRKFGVLHSRKYELPTEKIWEKFVGVRPEDMADSDLTMKVGKLETRIKELEGSLEGQRKLTKKLIEELGK